jgi:hypothetical protein
MVSAPCRGCLTQINTASNPHLNNMRHDPEEELMAAMAGPIAHWHTEHVYFRQLLDLLHREVDVFAQGARTTS